MCQEYCDCVVCLHLKFDILLSRMQKVSFNKEIRKADLKMKNVTGV